jgi:hypothetical protein
VSWTSPATGFRHHGWIRSGKPVDRSAPRRWRWACRDCGSVLEKGDLRSDYPTAQEVLNAGVHSDCGVQAARSVMES